MKLRFQPKSQLENFGQKVFSALVENFPQTFFVGGMVRDWLLGKKITDIDIATAARPQEIIGVLETHGIAYSAAHQNFGVIVAKQGGLEVEIATLRKDLQSSSRYPKISFITSPKADSQRRDFSVNALYLRPKTAKILDFHQGLADLGKRQIKFIGKPEVRLKEDPLRLVRALRFCLILDFKLAPAAKNAIKNNFHLLKNLTQSRVEKEINKLGISPKKIILRQVLDNPQALDIYFK